MEAKDSRPSPEQLLIDAERAVAEAKAKTAFRAQAARLKEECRKLPTDEKGQLAAFLMDCWIRMRSCEVADLLGHTKVWVRVYKHFSRKTHPCGGERKSCGHDRAACAHRRGRQVLGRVLRRAGLKLVSSASDRESAAWKP